MHSYKEIVRAACEVSGITPAQIHEKDRRREVVDTRRAIVQLLIEQGHLREEDPNGLLKYFNVDRATCYHYFRTTKTLLETNHGFRDRIRETRQRLKWNAATNSKSISNQ